MTLPLGSTRASQHDQASWAASRGAGRAGRWSAAQGRAGLRGLGAWSLPRAGAQTGFSPFQGVRPAAPGASARHSTGAGDLTWPSAQAWQLLSPASASAARAHRSGPRRRRPRAVSGRRRLTVPGSEKRLLVSPPQSLQGVPAFPG